MIHTDAFAAKARFAEDDQLLPGRDHLLDVMEDEPTTDKGLAQRGRVLLFKSRLKNLFPASESAELRFHDFAAQANGLVAFLARELRKLMPVFVAPRKVSEQITHGLKAEALQREQPRTRNPVEISQGLRNFDHGVEQEERSA